MTVILHEQVLLGSWTGTATAACNLQAHANQILTAEQCSLDAITSVIFCRGQGFRGSGRAA